MAAKTMTPTGTATALAIFTPIERPLATVVCSAGPVARADDRMDDLEGVNGLVLDEVGDMVVTRATVEISGPVIVDSPIDGSMGQPLAVEDGHTGVVFEGLYFDF
jgi:hypothetical protein